MFKEVPNQVKFAQMEEAILELWRDRNVFKQSLSKDAPKGDYIFFEGPPTANGKPGIHHVISRCFKDLFPRFKTMQGYRVGRKGGWDTHGLPVEVEIEKKLGFKDKKDIEAFGIAEFNRLCKESVFSNIQDWNWMTERMAYWVDLEDPYITYENRYIESCWWVMKSLWERDLLFEDYKVTMHCPRCNTSLSDHEVSQGYQDDVDDPSVWPKFPMNMREFKARGLVETADEQVYIMAWTTTPWTLAANTGLAVRGDADYGLFRAPKQHGSETHDLFILATAMAEKTFGEGNYHKLAGFKGEALLGLHYEPVLEGHCPAEEDLSQGFRILADDFVEIDPEGEGTGVVHLAPAYGDLEIGKANGLPTLFSVDLSGEVYAAVKPRGFADGPGPYTGQFFKQADKAISKDLLAANLMYRQARIKHTYPFCWRCKNPLLFYAKGAWYLRTTAVKDKLVANNQVIHWTPEHIRDGRFGKWLENNIDWSLSRERYWGCPLPMWLADDGEQHCIGSIKELEQLSGRDLSELELHRPYVDDITFEKNGKVFRRVPYTVDVWFESGAMPYAQWHYMGEGSNEQEEMNFRSHFPADYICEAIDQTRGWFYSLHALSTLLTDSGDDGGQRRRGVLVEQGIAEDTSAFKNVICLGHILDEKGEKMSKSKGNIVEPEAVLNKQGADALRWYLFSAAPPGNSRRFSENLVDETLRDFFMTLWNSYSFFVLYANLDKPDLGQDVPVRERPEIDRWLVAKVHQLIKDVTNMLESYDPTPASRAIRDFVVDDLSNWYVRRNRRRFWKSESDSDKLAAYKTLYETLISVAKLMAPMAPFVSEEIYQNLVKGFDDSAPDSVHLSSWPEADDTFIDQNLLRDMNALIRVVELGRGARALSKLKVRQPLPEVLVRVRSEEEQEGLKHLEDQILEELNVKQVTYLDVHADFVDYSVKPNLPLIGKRLGKLVPDMKRALAAMDGKEIAANVREGKLTHIELAGQGFEFEPEAFLLNAESPEGYAALEERGYLAALNTQLTPELIREGMVRDVIRSIQEGRKNAGLEVSDKITLGLEASPEVAEAVKAHAESLQREVLAESLVFTTLADALYNEAVELAEGSVVISFNKS